MFARQYEGRVIREGCASVTMKLAWRAMRNLTIRMTNKDYCEIGFDLELFSDIYTMMFFM